MRNTEFVVKLAKNTLKKDAFKEKFWLMKLEIIAECLRDFRKNVNLCEAANKMEAAMIDAIRSQKAPPDFYKLYRTNEGSVIQAFSRLYARYGDNLARELSKIAVPMDFRKILDDRATYKRFKDFTDRELSKDERSSI